MKKTFKHCIAALFAAFALNSCEDVPAPYMLPTAGVGETEETDGIYSSANMSDNWSLVAKGNQPWSKGNSYAQATGYQKWDGADAKSNKEVEGYLVSPAINTTAASGKVKFNFDQTLRYTNNDADYANHGKIFVSKNYDGQNFDAATWEEITAFKPTPSPHTDWTLYSSGDLQLPDAYVNQEKVYVAFYFYAPASGSTTWEVNNFKMVEGVAGEVTEEPSEPSTPAADGITVSGTTVTLNNADVTAGSESVTIDLNSFGYANATDVTVVESNGCTITFGNGANTTNAPKFYTATKGVRMYANNVVSFIAEKPIAIVVLQCDSYNGTDYVGNSTKTLDITDNQFTLTNTHTAASGGVQLRIQKVTITYAQ